MKLKKLVTAACLGLGMACLAVPVHAAALINPILVPGVNEFQDTDAERILRDGRVVTTGLFQTGDIIQTILRFDTVNASDLGDLSIDGTLPLTYQLTAYAELKVAAIFNFNTTDACNTAFCTLVFAPSGDLSEVNAFVDVYERLAGDPSFSQTVDPVTGIANVLAQDLIASLGIGEADDYWFANTFVDIGLAAGLGADDPQAANGQFGLSLLSNPGALPVAPNAMQGFFGNFHDFVGNASAYQRSPGVNQGWLVSSNTSVQFTQAVPEPGTLALAGLALLAVGVASRRKS